MPYLLRCQAMNHSCVWFCRIERRHRGQFTWSCRWERVVCRSKPSTFVTSIDPKASLILPRLCLEQRTSPSCSLIRYVHRSLMSLYVHPVNGRPLQPAVSSLDWCLSCASLDCTYTDISSKTLGSSNTGMQCCDQYLCKCIRFSGHIFFQFNFIYLSKSKYGKYDYLYTVPEN